MKIIRKGNQISIGMRMRQWNGQDFQNIYGTKYYVFTTDRFFKSIEAKHKKENK